jgi:hypothetical protein
MGWSNPEMAESSRAAQAASCRDERWGEAHGAKSDESLKQGVELDI